MNNYNVPILLLIFNRPETTSRVFEAIRSVRPKQLFVAADGPRKNFAEEFEKCELTRKIVNNIDWQCEIKTLFRDDNLGCKKAIESAIDWFFSNTSRGVILEDDCLPNNSFFLFCEKMLNVYENNPSIGIITGSSFLKGKFTRRNDYYFSNNIDIWGWATWKQIWELNKKVITDSSCEISSKISNRYKNQKYCEYLFSMLEQTQKGKLSSWAVIFQYYLILNNLLAIVPYKNLISNIGETGTHNTVIPSPFLNLPTYEIDFNKLSFNKDIIVNNKTDIKLLTIALKGISKANGDLTIHNKFMNKIKDSYNYRKQLIKAFFYGR